MRWPLHGAMHALDTATRFWMLCRFPCASHHALLLMQIIESCPGAAHQHETSNHMQHRLAPTHRAPRFTPRPLLTTLPPFRSWRRCRRTSTSRACPSAPPLTTPFTRSHSCWSRALARSTSTAPTMPPHPVRLRRGVTADHAHALALGLHHMQQQQQRTHCRPPAALPLRCCRPTGRPPLPS